MTEEQRQQFIEDARVELIRSHVYRRDTAWQDAKWVIFSPDTPGQVLREFEGNHPTAVLIHMGSADRTL